jgi:hypothetical protein
MKLRKHDSGITGCFLSSVKIILINNKNCLTELKKALDTGYDNRVEYCILIGEYSLIEPMTKDSQIADSYGAKWLGDQYCILSHRNMYRHPIPEAEIIDIGTNYFLISLRNTKIMFLTQLRSFSSVIKNLELQLRNVHIVHSCDENYNPENDPDQLEDWEYHPNYPDFHTFINRSPMKLDIADFSQRLNGANICNIHMPYWQNEHILSCLRAM